jgi:HSP20 family protein
MTLVTRRDGNGTRIARDPFALARDLFAWDLFGENGRTPSAFAPRFEVKERNDAFEIKADVPGVKEDDLDISLHEGVLSISGTRAGEQKKEGEAYYVYERQFGSFSRSFSLPEVADGDKVEAHLGNGVLTVTVGKKAAAQPKKISLKKG